MRIQLEVQISDCIWNRGKGHNNGTAYAIPLDPSPMAWGRILVRHTAPPAPLQPCCLGLGTLDVGDRDRESERARNRQHRFGERKEKLKGIRIWGSKCKNSFGGWMRMKTPGGCHWTEVHFVIFSSWTTKGHVLHFLFLMWMNIYDDGDFTVDRNNPEGVIK